MKIRHASLLLFSLIFLVLGAHTASTPTAKTPAQSQGGAGIAQNIISIMSQLKVITIMPLGASITWGFRSTSGNGYRATLLELLDSEHYLNHKMFTMVGNVQSGNTTSSAFSSSVAWPGRIISQCTGNVTNYLQPANKSITPACPNVTLIHAGTNDMAVSSQRITAPQHMAELLDTLLSICPNLSIFVAELIPSSNPQTNSYIKTFNAAVPGIVQARTQKGGKVATVDMFDVLDPATDLYDTIHPNDLGYVKMAKAWAAAMNAKENEGWF